MPIYVRYILCTPYPVQILFTERAVPVPAALQALQEGHRGPGFFCFVFVACFASPILFSSVVAFPWFFVFLGFLSFFRSCLSYFSRLLPFPLPMRPSLDEERSKAGRDVNFLTSDRQSAAIWEVWRVVSTPNLLFCCAFLVETRKREIQGGTKLAVAFSFDPFFFAISGSIPLESGVESAFEVHNCARKEERASEERQETGERPRGEQYSGPQLMHALKETVKTVAKCVCGEGALVCETVEGKRDQIEKERVGGKERQNGRAARSQSATTTNKHQLP